MTIKYGNVLDVNIRERPAFPSILPRIPSAARSEGGANVSRRVSRAFQSLPVLDPISQQLEGFTSRLQSVVRAKEACIRECGLLLGHFQDQLQAIRGEPSSARKKRDMTLFSLSNGKLESEIKGYKGRVLDLERNMNLSQ